MGRSLIVENLIEAQIANLFGSQKLQVGLLIGQLTDTRDFIIHIAQAPDPVENEAEIESTEEERLLQGDTAVETKIIKKESNPNLKMKNEEDFDENWVIEHARQVHRMLPGGLSVAGIYIFSKADFMNKYQSKLKHCLQKVHKQLEKNKFLRAVSPHNDRILLHICSDTRKITCRTLDFRDSQSSLRPAEFKYQSFLHKWHTLKCVANINLYVRVPTSAEKNKSEVQIQHSLHDYMEEVWNSVAMINKEIIRENDSLYAPSKGSRAKKEEGQLFQVELFSPCVSTTETLQKQQSIGMVTLTGAMASRAYVHNKATKGMVARAIKMDIIRSIESRVELLCEEAEVNYLYQVENWSMISPTRIFAALANGPVHFCDYAFKDEKLKDSIDRFSELLHLTFTEQDLISFESSPVSDNQHSSCSDEGDTRSQISTESIEAPEHRAGFSKGFGCLLALLMVVVAALIMFVSG